MKQQQSGSMAAMLLALVAVGTVLLAVYPSAVMGYSSYECYENKDHNSNTIRRVDCYDNENAASLEGCQAECDANYKCKGIVFIPNSYGWKNGIICCFLKKKIGKLQGQDNRTTCKKLNGLVLRDIR
ncbi:hypothetical protein CBR_g21276 [Chara braunii]|uniref:Apple domain-containing protein n=1 Tax=Chara braunii TaxID=69332 RepID=A0A388L136_CHABU|nr:hypothetical protein CBR_g21276 [Chara braunii]|eukprot:GBG76036.1 hypothetical protein CBR_g21276 [Chara braunii]